MFFLYFLWLFFCEHRLLLLYLLCIPLILCFYNVFIFYSSLLIIFFYRWLGFLCTVHVHSIFLFTSIRFHDRGSARSEHGVGDEVVDERKGGLSAPIHTLCISPSSVYRDCGCCAYTVIHHLSCIYLHNCVVYWKSCCSNYIDRVVQGANIYINKFSLILCINLGAN